MRRSPGSGTGSVLVGFLNPLGAPGNARALADAGVTAFAVEAIPRISRAQSMDALSSQANVAGLPKSVILAAETLPRFFPMLMTAAGTIPPGKVLVLGAGVAGLQALATAKRLGAKATATTCARRRPSRSSSLGAEFWTWASSAAGEGGYARELTEEERAQQQQSCCPTR